MEKVTITWGDGTQTEAELNGNSYAVAEAFIPADLSEVTIEKADGTLTMLDPLFFETAKLDERFWFSFMEKTEADRAREALEKQRADINFIAVMSDIDLEEG